MRVLAFWEWKLHWQVLTGMAIGVLIATVLPELTSTVAPLGTIFLRLLRMVIVPLIFSSIVAGVAGIGDPRSLGRLGVKTLLYYAFTSLLASSPVPLVFYVAGLIVEP